MMLPNLDYDYRDVIGAYFDCIKGKRNKFHTRLFDLSSRYELPKLYDEISSRRYTPGRSRVFIVTWPKPREVWAAQFRDRIIHHLVCNDLIPIYDKRFIEDSYACRTGKGVLAAADRAEAFLRSVTENYHKEAFALKADIANFFVSIDKPILWNILRPSLPTGSHLEYLLYEIISYDPSVNPVIRNRKDFDKVPRHKSLFYCAKTKGLPIGNLTSQFFANLYMDGLDKYAKHVLKIKKYIRYVDDILIFSKSRDELIYYKEQLSKWAMENRALHFHPDKTNIISTEEPSGIEFVGRVLKKFHSVPRKLVVDKSMEAAKRAGKYPSEHNLNSVKSYIGMFKHSDTYGLIHKLQKQAKLIP